MTKPFEEWAHRVRHGAKMGWYAAHYAAAKRLSGTTASQGQGNPGQGKPGKSGRQTAVRAAMRELINRDWRNVEAGLYTVPLDLERRPLDLLAASRAFFRDVPAVERRRAQHRHAEVLTEERRALYPRYYLQNFHYQTDGYLSETSARLYDFQVETLFSGTADLMRRQALVPLRTAVEGRDQRRLKLADVACGTGSFLKAVKHNYPRLAVTALDLSPDYLAEARKALESWHDVDIVRANAESMPLEDESFDVVTCIYLFHELPPEVRKTVLKEIRRILKPDGTLIFVDSIQQGDMPSLDPLLDHFPEGFHEPYYGSYVRTDLHALFGEAGFSVTDESLAFLSKVVTAAKGSAV